MSEESTNPLLAPSPLPHGAPDFARLRDSHFAPAFEKTIADHRAAVRAIADNDAPPTFANTVEALERSGRALERVHRVFMQLDAADTNPERQALNRRFAPILAAHDDAILLDQALFARIRTLYDQRAALAPDSEQRMLLERHHLRFVRAGAALPEASRERLRAINQRIASAMAEFGDNVRDDTAAFVHLVTDEAAVAGLPADVIDRAREEASVRGHAGAFAFTLQEPVVFAVLHHANHRPLREALYAAYKNRGNNGNAYDNNRLAGEIAQLRAEAASLLGYATHADYALADAMAGTPQAAVEMLERVWPAALANARREAERLQRQIESDGDDFVLAPWDWWYYAERVRRAEYAFDENALRPYLPLARVRDGAFLLAQRLFGLQFAERADLPAWHPDVQVFEVNDAAGGSLGLIYMDFLTRPSKRFGAWMTSFQVQSHLLGDSAIVTNTLNCGRATDGEPVLLSFEQARILFHEFGHALHGLLSDVRYPSLSGTAVARDFVELPSQLNENWLATPELLREIGRHHETDEPVPEALIAQLLASRQFNEGFAATEYLASALVDMAWYRRAAGEPAITDAIAFENEVVARIGLIPEILPRHRSTHFGHIFAGGYAAGYYSYIWAEVLDADVFDAFRESGLFDPALGERLRATLLSRGRSVDPMDAFVSFRGRTPSPQPLLRRRGLLPAQVDDVGN
jgi:peptidyl-dipeptidase Dcp